MKCSLGISNFLEENSAAATAKSLQLCPTLGDPVDVSPPGSPAPGILQARALEWVAISFSSAWKWKVKVKLLSGVQLFATPWTTAYQAPLSMGVCRQEYWSGVPLPSPTTLFQILTWSITSLKLKVNIPKSYLTLCDPMDYTVHGILQARILEWVDFPFSRGSPQPRDQTQVSHVSGRFFASWATKEAH